MKKKELLEHLDRLTDVLNRTSVTVVGGELDITQEEMDALACGLMGGLMEALLLLGHDVRPDPEEECHALISDAVKVYAREKMAGGRHE